MRDEIWIPTYSGREINLMDPNPDDITLEDIAHHLACQNRYLGCSIRPYSVAEHSVRLAYATTKLIGTKRAYWGKEALLHDALEAFTGDLPRMLVLDLNGSNFEVVQRNVDAAVRKRFDMNPNMDAWLVAHDRAICQVEIRSGLFNQPYRKHCLLAYRNNGTTFDAASLERALKDYDRTWLLGSLPWGWNWRRAKDKFLEAASDYGIV